MKTPIRVQALQRVIDTCFEGNVAAFSRAVGESPNTVQNWRSRGRVPAAHCPAIEVLSRHLSLRLADVVICEQLAPEVSWCVLRGAPLSPDEQKTALAAARIARREAKKKAEAAA